MSDENDDFGACSECGDQLIQVTWNTLLCPTCDELPSDDECPACGSTCEFPNYPGGCPRVTGYF